VSWVVVVPVKGTPGAKSRLGTAPSRADLADAFALDTVAALLAAPSVARVLVVSGDPLLSVRLAGLGAEIVPEDERAADAPADGVLPDSVEPGQPGDSLNRAIRRGLSVVDDRFPGLNRAVMTGDLPGLTPGEVEQALELADLRERSIVPDSAGTGTTTLLALAGVPIVPRFGPDSRAAHEASGHVPLPISASAGIRRDVDTMADLAIAEGLGSGPYTRAVLDSRRSKDGR